MVDCSDERYIVECKYFYKEGFVVIFMGRRRSKLDPNYVFTLWVKRDEYSGESNRAVFEKIFAERLGLTRARNYLVAETPSHPTGEGFPLRPMETTLCVAAPNVFGLRANIVKGESEIKKYLRSTKVKGRIAKVVGGG